MEDKVEHRTSESWGGWEAIEKLRSYDIPPGGVLGRLASFGGALAFALEDYSLRDSLKASLSSVGALPGTVLDNTLGKLIEKLIEDEGYEDLTPTPGKIPSLLRKILTEEEEKPQNLEMQIYGNREVIDRFRSEEKDPNRKLCVISLGGGQAGNNGTGMLLGMDDTGALDNADVLIGVSCGIANFAYIKAGQGDFGSEIYRVDNTQNQDFIKLSKNRAARIKKLIEILGGSNDPNMDTAIVGRVMRDPDKRQDDIETRKSCRQDILTVVMDVEDGTTKVIDLKSQKDPISAIEAAICVPGVSTIPWVTLEDGRNYADGFYANPIPLDVAKEKGCTDVLIVANSTLAARGGFLADLQPFVSAKLSKRKTYGYNKKVIDVVRQANKRNRQALNDVYNAITSHDPNFRVAVIEPRNNIISNICDDSEKLTKAFMEAREYGKNLFTPAGEVTPVGEQKIPSLEKP